MATINPRGFYPVCTLHNVYFDPTEKVWFKRFDIAADLLNSKIMGAPVACPLCEKEAKDGTRVH